MDRHKARNVQGGARRGRRKPNLDKIGGRLTLVLQVSRYVFSTFASCQHFCFLRRRCCFRLLFVFVCASVPHSGSPQSRTIPHPSTLDDIMAAYLRPAPLVSCNYIFAIACAWRMYECHVNVRPLIIMILYGKRLFQGLECTKNQTQKSCDMFATTWPCSRCRGLRSLEPREQKRWSCDNVNL